MSRSLFEKATECPLRYAEMLKLKGAELVWGEVRSTRASGRRWRQRRDRKAKWAFSKGPQEGDLWMGTGTLWTLGGVQSLCTAGLVVGCWSVLRPG